MKDDFSEEHCISANDNQDVENKQIMLNSLEDKTNPYRAVFAVDKLNEGWDVLNLLILCAFMKPVTERTVFPERRQ